MKKMISLVLLVSLAILSFFGIVWDISMKQWLPTSILVFITDAMFYFISWKKSSHHFPKPTVQEVITIFKEFLRKNLIVTVLFGGWYIILLFKSETTPQIKFYLISVLVFYFSSGFLVSINKSLQKK